MMLGSIRSAFDLQSSSRAAVETIEWEKCRLDGNSMIRQFAELANPVEVFEPVFSAALTTLVPDLADAPWYIREHDVINLFVFSHLTPEFQKNSLDIAQIAIESPVRKLPKHATEKPGTWADIAIWAHKKATMWRTCKPIARIEWKNISCREKLPTEIERQHKRDIERLKDESAFASVTYAVITRRCNEHVELLCTRVLHGTEPSLFLKLNAPATGDESAFKDFSYREMSARPQSCPHCNVAIKFPCH